MSMVFEKQENGVRTVKMPNWSLTLTPIKTEKGEGFVAQYFEKDKEELRFALSSDYVALWCEEATRKNKEIVDKILGFFDVFQKMDELEEVERTLKWDEQKKI